MILVSRVDELPEPYVPSIIVACSKCKAKCWLSQATGHDTIKASMIVNNDALFLCACCAGFCVADKHGQPDKT